MLKKVEPFRLQLCWKFADPFSLLLGRQAISGTRTASIGVAASGRTGAPQLERIKIPTTFTEQCIILSQIYKLVSYHRDKEINDLREQSLEKRASYKKNYNIRNKEKNLKRKRQYDEEHHDEIQRKRIKYREKNRKELNEKQQIRYSVNHENLKNTQKEYDKKNSIIKKEKQSKYNIKFSEQIKQRQQKYNKNTSKNTQNTYKIQRIHDNSGIYKNTKNT